MKGFMLASPNSGSGKTVLTMAILRHLSRAGIAVSPIKAGPDYIDPAFHEMACHHNSVNLDCWAMRKDLVYSLSAQAIKDNRLMVAEAMMGLFDGASNGQGSAADLARKLALPIILVVDCSKMSHSIAPLVFGFHNFADDIVIAGIILNKVGSINHEKLLKDALKPLNINIIGVIPRNKKLHLPDRHLGLIQAHEMLEIDRFIDEAADFIGPLIDFENLLKIAKKPFQCNNINDTSTSVVPLKPIGQHIAIARDNAFRFVYHHILVGWQRQGAVLSFFSPLADEKPDEAADAIYLPGGYPELFAEKLAHATQFKASMHDAKVKGKTIYGECGGYMVLGEYIEDKNGAMHAMLGLLPLITSMKQPKLHIGYRKLSPLTSFLWQDNLRGHEFHYAQTIKGNKAIPLFSVTDARNEQQNMVGMQLDNVAGSFMHVIDRE